jgi:hypothetical protein
MFLLQNGCDFSTGLLIDKPHTPGIEVESQIIGSCLDRRTCVFQRFDAADFYFGHILSVMSLRGR